MHQNRCGLVSKFPRHQDWTNAAEVANYGLILICPILVQRLGAGWTGIVKKCIENWPFSQEVSTFQRFR